MISSADKLDLAWANLWFGLLVQAQRGHMDLTEAGDQPANWLVDIWYAFEAGSHA